MGTYIAHKRRRIRRLGSGRYAAERGRSETLERQLALQREIEKIELERASAAKSMRALERRMERRTAAVDRTSGRQRTAVRVAGVVIVSGTVGFRTRAVSIRRLPNSAPTELWAADVRFENEGELPYRFNSAIIPASDDLMHLMRYAAPRVAEKIHMGSATAGADDNNNETVRRLAESYMRKVHHHMSLSDGEKRELAAAIIRDLEITAALRIHNFHQELMWIVDSLMHSTRFSRRECERILSRIYADQGSRIEVAKPRLFELSRVPKAS